MWKTGNHYCGSTNYFKYWRMMLFTKALTHAHSLTFIIIVAHPITSSKAYSTNARKVSFWFYHSTIWHYFNTKPIRWFLLYRLIIYCVHKLTMAYFVFCNMQQLTFTFFLNWVKKRKTSGGFRSKTQIIILWV